MRLTPKRMRLCHPMQFHEMKSVCIEPEPSHTTMWLPDAAAWTPRRPSILTTMRDSTGTIACSGLFAPRPMANEVRRSSNVVTNGSTISSAHVSAIRVRLTLSLSRVLTSVSSPTASPTAGPPPPVRRDRAATRARRCSAARPGRRSAARLDLARGGPRPDRLVDGAGDASRSRAGAVEIKRIAGGAHGRGTHRGRDQAAEKEDEQSDDKPANPPLVRRRAEGRWLGNGRGRRRPARRTAAPAQPAAKHVQPPKVAHLVGDPARLRRAEPRAFVATDQSFECRPTLEWNERE